jgi:phosphosulfolactate synthase (CoM biosynthesis protein A)
MPNSEKKNHDLISFDFLRTNLREKKPRTKGVTEIRAAYYSPFGYNYFQDLLATVGEYIDSIKFAGGSFTMMPPDEIKRIIDLAHENDVLVSTGGFIEYVLTLGKEAVLKYIEACRRLDFDIVEISAGFISIPTDDWLRIIDGVIKAGMKANADPWRVDVPAAFINEIGLEKLMFESADPPVFEWYIKNYGYEVNLFVDHSQIVQLEAYRQGIWGTKSIWGRVVGYK